jgi:hypothetical protein
MSLCLTRSTIAVASLFCAMQIAFSQTTDKTESASVRMMVTTNPDGSRTVYKFDDAKHKCVATTTNQDGKLKEKIRYELDEAGRFATGRIFGPDGKFRFNSRYKYDGAGRLEEETQTSEKDAPLNKIVYSYDQTGKQTGYSIFDGSGKLLGRTTAPTPTASPKTHQKK